MTLTATLPRRLHLDSLSPHGYHRIAYYEWGDPANRDVVICVHGLARNGRDFDVLAERLSARHRVIAVDMPGRGASDWLRAPADYVFPTYLTVMTALIARLGAELVDLVGTSMGGLIGIAMAAQPRTPIRRLVVNDVGPVIEAAALARIAAYVGLDPTFANYAEAETYIRTVSAPFGPHSDAQWEHLARSNLRTLAAGRYALGYDPAIAVPFRAEAAPPDLWPLWDAIRCPTLVTRGAQSDLLSAATAQAMTERGPRAKLVSFAGVGHAPTFLHADQVDAVEAFLDGAPAAA